MGQKKHRPEEIVARLRQVDVLVSQGRSMTKALRSVGVTQFTCSRWRREFGGLKADQVKHLKELEKENERLRKAVFDLTLVNLIQKEVASATEGPRRETPDFRWSRLLRRPCQAEVPSRFDQLFRA